MALLGETSVASIFSSQEKHIVFPVSDEGAMEKGSAGMAFNRWPGLLSKIGRRSGVAIEEGGKWFYPIECYFHRDKIGWGRAPEIFKEFLTKGLPIPLTTPTGVIVPSSEYDLMLGVKIDILYPAVKQAAEQREIMAYINLWKEEAK
ncbi:MAG TPA: hypothetical protein VJZ94_00780 [Candidatus Paceibacterota bacterium]|uniref:Uncharacterized protein n=1 Tax=Candidatus Adlerbacteria bacterium RIFCSPLOWO2_01_FULL_51_16 TaxID=1797243 RepID=A0A1F4XG64_9BACT|nr:MAG: hypothetical protein A2943_00960 [Candidatus Adlerbacteria bacterium RIFCSPLOWO2_01_FULL_51_16]HXK31274.1 hypothetical protein [Candidatus Paceibacterota bacterium]